MKHGLFAVVFVALFVLDQWSKSAVFESLTLPGGGSDEYEVVEGVFKFRLVRNPGMMWGLAQDVPAFVWVIIRSGVFAGLLWIYLTLDRHTRITQVAFGLVAAGALGNIWDNIFQGASGLFEGTVRDFLCFYWFEFPTFNVADSCICVGAPLLLVVLWNHDRQRLKKNSEPSSLIS